MNKLLGSAGVVFAASLASFGYWEDKSGTVSVLSGEIGITENDKPSAAVTEIAVDYGATLWITNLTTKWEMTTPISGQGKIRVKGCSANLIINADNRNYRGAPKGQPGYFSVEDATTTVIVSNRYGLGSSSFKKNASAFSSNSFKFGGNGLTNDVGISSGNYYLQPTWSGETGTFVQNGPLDGYMFRFYCSAEMYGSTLGNGNMSNIEVPGGCSFTVGTNVYVKGSTSASGAAVMLGLGLEDTTYDWGTSSTNCYRYLTISGTRTKVVCIGKDAFKCASDLDDAMGYVNIHNKANMCSMDMNGYDQSLPWISTYGYSSATTRLLINSDTPATMTFYCKNASGNNLGDLLFTGQASFTYAGAAGSVYQIQNVESTSSGRLSVTSGTLKLGNGSVNWSWAGKEIVASGTGTLVLNKKISFPYTENGKTRSVLRITDNATVQVADDAQVSVGSIRIGNDYLHKGVYGSADAYAAGKVDADHVLAQLSGAGTLTALTSGEGGLMLILR